MPNQPAIFVKLEPIINAPIAKPEGEIFPSPEIASSAEVIESPEQILKKVFEDAEFILDEILIEKNLDESDLSRAIIKPSQPLIQK